MHAGDLIARQLQSYGVNTVFTLSGGHIFPLYDGFYKAGIRLVDVRHEATAAFAAEGWSKVTRTPGVCAVTAGPGVTNTMSAITAATANESPLVVLAGRAPEFRWGQGSLQEIDHVPFVSPVTRRAATARSVEVLPAELAATFQAASAVRGGAAFLDIPLDIVFAQLENASPDLPACAVESSIDHDHEGVTAIAKHLAKAQRPIIMAGSGCYWGKGETALEQLVTDHQIPVYMNGLGRGCVPADHSAAFSRSRSFAFRNADVVVLVGVPMDFRLGFGSYFAENADVFVLEEAKTEHEYPCIPQAEVYGDVNLILTDIANNLEKSSWQEKTDWIQQLQNEEQRLRSEETVELTDTRAPLHPMRIYAELAPLLDRDAIIVCDGGDFASYAGKLIDSFTPGSWIDPGPFGCLGSGFGYALGAKLARPEKQVVLLLGDGAFGFSGLEIDTLVRHGVYVVGIIGNNGIWGLEKHPMEALYGYSVAADLRPQTRYDAVAQALGAQAEYVDQPNALRPALERALAASGPVIVNVITDPAVAYPRRAMLA